MHLLTYKKSVFFSTHKEPAKKSTVSPWLDAWPVGSRRLCRVENVTFRAKDSETIDLGSEAYQQKQKQFVYNLNT